MKTFRIQITLRDETTFFVSIAADTVDEAFDRATVGLYNVAAIYCVGVTEPGENLADSKQITWTADHGSGFRYTLKRLATGRGQLFVTNPGDGTIHLIDDTIADYANFVANYLQNAASATDLEVIA